MFKHSRLERFNGVKEIFLWKETDLPKRLFFRPQDALAFENRKVSTNKLAGWYYDSRSNIQNIWQLGGLASTNKHASVCSRAEAGGYLFKCLELKECKWPHRRDLGGWISAGGWREGAPRGLNQQLVQKYFDILTIGRARRCLLVNVTWCGSHQGDVIYSPMQVWPQVYEQLFHEFHYWSPSVIEKKKRKKNQGSIMTLL